MSPLADPLIASLVVSVSLVVIFALAIRPVLGITVIYATQFLELTTRTLELTIAIGVTAVALVVTFLKRGLRFPQLPREATWLGLWMMVSVLVLAKTSEPYGAIGVIGLQAMTFVVPIVARDRRIPETFWLLLVVGPAMVMLMHQPLDLLAFKVRYAGPLENPNEWAVWLIPAVPVGLSVLVRRIACWKKAIVLGMLVIDILGLVGTGSRSALIGVTMGSLLVVVVTRKRGLGLLVAVMMTLLLVVPSVQTELRELVAGVVRYSEDASAMERLSVWSAGMKIFRDHPLGVGWGMARSVMTEYGATRDLPAHNAILGVALESGVPGLIGIVGFVIAQSLSAARILSLRRSHSDAWLQYVGASGAILAGWVHNMFHTQWAIWFWLLTGVMFALYPKALSSGAFRTKEGISGAAQATP